MSNPTVALREAKDFVWRTHDAVLSRLGQYRAHQVVYHADVDGLCAAALLAAIIGTATHRRVAASWVPTSEFHFGRFIQAHPSSDERCYVSVDINFTSKAKFTQLLDKTYGSSLIVIDDHVPNDGFRPHDALMINPNYEREDPIDLASSLYGYLLAKTVGLNPPDWVAVLGLYFDRQLDLYRDAFDSVPAQAELDRAIRVLSATYLDDSGDRTEDAGLSHISKAIATRATWSDFLSKLQADDGLVSLHLKNEAEIDRVCLGLPQNIKHVATYSGERLFVSEFTSNLQIANIIASRMRANQRSGIFLAIRRSKGFSQFELRLGFGVANLDLVALLERISDKVELANFGGHRRAAGGAVKSDNVSDFLTAVATVGEG